MKRTVTLKRITDFSGCDVGNIWDNDGTVCSISVCFWVPLRIHIYQENIFQRRFLTTVGETDGFTLNLSPGQKLLKLC